MHAAATHSVYHALQRRQQVTLSRLALTPGDIVVATLDNNVLLSAEDAERLLAKMRQCEVHYQTEPYITWCGIMDADRLISAVAVGVTCATCQALMQRDGIAVE